MREIKKSREKGEDSIPVTPNAGNARMSLSFENASNKFEIGPNDLSVPSHKYQTPSSDDEDQSSSSMDSYK